MRHYRFLLPIAVLFVTVLLISNTVSAKLLQLGPFTIAGGIILFPISYIFGDILTEVYGYRASRKIIWFGFATQIIMSISYWIVQLLPAPVFWTNQSAYELILGAVPRIVAASIIAFLVGEFANSYVLSRMKIWSNGKHLWMRTIGSTLVGEGVDSALFVMIAFAGTFPWPALFTVFISGYILKVAYEVIITPITYIVVRKLKHAEQVDVYDRDISYNPFKLNDTDSIHS